MNMAVEMALTASVALQILVVPCSCFSSIYSRGAFQKIPIKKKKGNSSANSRP
jgi:hypothetical protein